MIGGMSAVENDVIPYSLAIGNRAYVKGINLVGLKRAKYKKNEIREYSNAVDQIFKSKSISTEKIKFNDTENPLIKDLISFLNKLTSRGLCKYEK